jgi:tetratricopeptide (TPR) repeat protein
MKESQKFALRLVLLILIGSWLSFVPVSYSVTEKAYQAQSAFVVGNYQEGAEHLTSLAEELPWWNSLWESAGDAAYLSGDYDLAKTAYEKADQKRALSDQGRLKLGDVYLKVDDLDSAEAIWLSLENNLAAVEKLANHYESQGSVAAAVESWQTYFSLSDESPSMDRVFHFGLLTAAYQPEGSLVFLDQAAEEHPDAEVVSKAVRLSLSEEPAYQYVTTGQALASINQWQLASRAFEKAAELRPDYLEAWAYWGEALQHLEDPLSDPLETLEKGLALDDRSPLVNMFLGLYWQRQGSHRTALEYFGITELAWPDYPDVYVEQGKSLAALAELELAVDKYQQAIDIKPEEGIYYSQLAEFCVTYSYQVKELGLPAARLAVQFDDRNPEFLVVLGQVLLDLGDEYNGQKFFQQALEVDSTFAPAYFQLGVLYSAQDDIDRARYYFQQVLTHTDNPSLIDQVQRLLP